jgi:hypothetical protein
MAISSKGDFASIFANSNAGLALYPAAENFVAGRLKPLPLCQAIEAMNSGPEEGKGEFGA